MNMIMAVGTILVAENIIWDPNFHGQQLPHTQSKSKQNVNFIVDRKFRVDDNDK